MKHIVINQVKIYNANFIDIFFKTQVLILVRILQVTEINLKC